MRFETRVKIQEVLLEFSSMSRLDQALVERGLCESREKAKRAVMAGTVKVNGQPARKPSDSVQPEDHVTVTAPDQYVSRGGHKLEHALRHFQLDVSGLTAIDVGAATGGFTDCLLQHGAATVYAVDVGHGQLAWKLRHNRRVIVMERTNARHLTAASFPQSFVPADMKAEADKGEGVITDPAIHQRVLRELEDFVATRGVIWRGVTDSPLLGPAGNKEFLVLLEKTP
jgi:23S rRNA (cytidine1920-2'-O)/16S rRNA (cytidine1409-2'-O)-methyltransferase